MNREQAFDRLEQALGMTSADTAEAVLQRHRVNSMRFADNAITQNEDRDDTTLALSVAFGRCHGGASTNDLSPESVRGLVQRAEAIARVTPPDPEYMPPLGAAESRKHLETDTYCADTAAVDPMTKARRFREASDRVRDAGLRLSGACRHTTEELACANSAGLRARRRSTLAQLRASVLADDGGSGWAEAVSNRDADIDFGATTGKALDIARSSRNPAPIEPGRYTAIISPAALAELLMFLYWGAFDAKATDEGRTCLRGKRGMRVCGENITIRSDPADPRCPAAAFHADGLAAPAVAWIRDGVLETLCTSRYWGEKQGTAPTGRPTNLIVDGGDSSVEEMIASTQKGLLITRFWYIRFVDRMGPLVTGMTRDGLFLVEDGEVKHAVRQMRFNENLLGLLSRVAALGAAERTEGFLGHYPNVLAPPVKIADFHFTDVTSF